MERRSKPNHHNQTGRSGRARREPEEQSRSRDVTLASWRVHGALDIAAHTPNALRTVTPRAAASDFGS
jgi:hypothetical protein